MAKAEGGMSGDDDDVLRGFNMSMVVTLLLQVVNP